MAYSERAKALRRCRASRKDGQPCKGYAVWGDPRGLCAAHGRHHTGPMPRQRVGSRKTNNPSCICQAYQWPHRPGGGYCQWPDVPEYRLTTPGGTKGMFNGESGWFSLGSRLNHQREEKSFRDLLERREVPEVPVMLPWPLGGPRHPEPEMTRDEEVAMILKRIGVER